jgi:gliding motility-associated-like protein
LTVTTEQGCTATHSEPNYINIYHNPIADFYFKPDEVTVIDPTVSFFNTSSFADSYNWSFGQMETSTETSPTIEYPEIGEQSYDIMLVAATNMGCVDTAYAIVEVKDMIVFYVPNTFTPDKDDFNEVFQPIFVSGFDPYDFHLTIFNRWGEILFESYDHNTGWNGTYGASNEKIVKDGAYIWKIEFKELMSDKRHIHHGHVNVLR